MARKNQARTVKTESRMTLSRDCFKDEVFDGTVGSKGAFGTHLEINEIFNGIRQQVGASITFYVEPDGSIGMLVGVFDHEWMSKNWEPVFHGHELVSEMGGIIIPPTKTEEDEIQEFDEKKNPEKEPVHICNDCGYPNPTTVRFCWGCHKDLGNGGFTKARVPTQ